MDSVCGNDGANLLLGGNGHTWLNTPVGQLILARAQFKTDTGLSWEQAAGGAGDPTQQAAYQSIIAAAWQ